MSTPVALTIAGSDSGAGAGIQADLKTFGAFRVYGTSVITAVTAQNTKVVYGIHEVPPEGIRAQMDAVFSDFDVRAVKIGMVSRASAVESVAAGLEHHRQHAIVLDPVMVASSGDLLLAPQALEALRLLLLPLALLVTPNLPEAAALLGVPVARTETEARAQAERLLALGPRAVLIKGGHAEGPESVDLLVESGAMVRFASTRLPARNTHGTGCTLSAAIAAGLAQGLDLTAAVRQGKAYVSAAIAAADRLNVGSGSGPLHHFHAWW